MSYYMHSDNPNNQQLWDIKRQTANTTRREATLTTLMQPVLQKQIHVEQRHLVWTVRGRGHLLSPKLNTSPLVYSHACVLIYLYVCMYICFYMLVYVTMFGLYYYWKFCWKNSNLIKIKCVMKKTIKTLTRHTRAPSHARPHIHTQLIRTKVNT